MLKGDKINLRALEPSDIDILYNWENNPEVWNVSNTIEPFSRHVLKLYIANSHKGIFSNKQLRLMICVHENDHAVGCIDLFEFDPVNQRAGIGIVVNDHKDRRNGYAKEALEILISYAFDTLHLHQLYCNVSAGNLASINLFERCAFQKVGVKKDWIRNNGKWEDVYEYQLINS